MISNKSVLSNLIWRFLERSGAQIVTFIVSIVLARILDPKVYGTVALVTIVITLLQVFVDSGLGNSLIQKKNADDTDFSTVFYFNVAMCSTLYLVLFLCAPLIANFYEEPTLTPVIRVLGITLIISGLKNVQQAYVSKNMLFKRFFFATLGGTIGSAVLGIIMALYGFGVWALVGQHLFNLIVDTIILWVTVKWRPKLLFSFRRLKGLFSFGWKLLVSSLIDTTYKELRQLIIGKKYSGEDLAYYNKGQHMPNLIIVNVNSSINSVLLPTMSKEQSNKDVVKAMTRRAIKTSSFILWPFMVGLGVCAEPIVRLLFTAKWLPCVPFLRIFCFTFAFYPIHTANLNAIKAMGRSDLFLKLEITKKIIGIALLLSTMWFGVMAMAYSLLVSTVISSIINAFPNSKLLRYNYFEQMKDISPAILLSAVMGAVVFCINFIGLSDILTLLIQVPLGVLIYVTGAKLFKFESFEYMFNLLKSFFVKKKKTTKVNAKQIEEFLTDVDKDFPVAISDKVDLKEYSNKLSEKATIVTEIKDNKIACMVAGYTENTEDNLAYVSIMATRKEFRGQGFAGATLSKFIDKCKQKGLKAVHLYTKKENQQARSVYSKLGFVEYLIENEPRPQDLHLILYLSEKE